MKIIFLDVDGVLNTRNAKDRFGTVIGIEDEKVKRLAQIVAQTGAKIYLTSSWKYGWSSDPYKCMEDGVYLNLKLAKYGLKIEDKVDMGISERGYEILQWIDWHTRWADYKIDSYVVLDDERFDFPLYPEFSGRIVKTDFYTKDGGLQEFHVKEAVRILNEMPVREGKIV